MLKRRYRVTWNRPLLKKKKYVKGSNEEGSDLRMFKKSFEERGLLAADVRDRRSSKESIKPKSGDENPRRYKIKTALSRRNRSGEKNSYLEVG